MKERNIFTVIILSIITLGIYDLYWLVKVKKELNARTDIRVPTIWLLLAPSLIMVAAAVAIMVGVTLSAVHQTADSTSSQASPGVGIAIVALMALNLLIVLPITFYWFFKFSKAVNHYTHGELNTAVTILLLWVLRFVGLAVMQDKFNEMIAANLVPQAAAAGAPAPIQPMPAVPSAPPTGPDPMPGSPAGEPGPAMPPQPPVVSPPQQPAAPESPEGSSPTTPQAPQPPTPPAGQ